MHAKKNFKTGEVRVTDDCYFSKGDTRDLAHQSCNLNVRVTYFIPVIIHTFKNYVNHLVLKNIPEKYPKRNQLYSFC